jgi:hypothetical protein
MRIRMFQFHSIFKLGTPHKPKVTQQRCLHVVASRCRLIVTTYHWHIAPISKYVSLKNQAPKLRISDGKTSKLEAPDKERGVPYLSVNL